MPSTMIERILNALSSVWKKNQVDISPAFNHLTHMFTFASKQTKIQSNNFELFQH